MNVNGSRLFQFFKYAVYALLAFNVYVFWAEEHLATAVQFSGGVGLGDMIDAYAASIDTAAWVVLLLMFELETYVLEDHHYNRTVTYSLHLIRAVCYAFIIYALYGYIVNLSYIYAATALPGVTDLCTLISEGWSYAVDLDEYTSINSANCGGFSSAIEFQRFAGILAVVDAEGLRDIRYLAWVDVINAAVWILVVVILEVDVWLQERNMHEGSVLRFSNACKFLLYAALLLAAIYWGIKGDFVDFWDAFLWLVAFAFIELNVLEWREEMRISDENGPQRIRP